MAEIPPHVQRMLLERDELADRTQKLREFIKENPLFQRLDDHDQYLLGQQEAHMSAYLIVLRQRIEREEGKQS